MTVFQMSESSKLEPVFTLALGWFMGVLSQLIIEVYKSYRSELQSRIKECITWLDQTTDRLILIERAVDAGGTLSDFQRAHVASPHSSGGSSLYPLIPVRLVERTAKLTNIVNAIVDNGDTTPTDGQSRALREGVRITLEELRYWKKRYLTIPIMPFVIYYWIKEANRKFGAKHDLTVPH